MMKSGRSNIINTPPLAVGLFIPPEELFRLASFGIYAMR
jgi:hypothetical protein